METKGHHISRIASKRFSKYIDCIKYYQFDSIDPILLHPEGHFEIIFQSEHEFQNDTITTNGWEKRPSSFVGGLHNQSYQIQAKTTNASLMSIQFKPEAARYFIPEKLSLLKNQIVDLHDLYVKDWLEPIQRISSDQSLAHKMNYIDAFLTNVFQKKERSPIEIGLKMIIERNGLVSIDQIAKSVGFSCAQFRKRFNAEVGMSPKEYAKITRVNHALQILAADPNLMLTKLAYQLGYFDQSHFIKEVRSVTGFSPKQFNINQTA